MSSEDAVASGFGFTAALRRVGHLSLLVGAYSALPLLVGSFPDSLDVGVVADAVLGTALGFLLVFRMNRAYERWWDARTLWGSLVNASRNLAIKVRELADVTAEDRQELCGLIVGFAHGLEAHLRGRPALDAVRPYVSSIDEVEHVPAELARRMYRLLSRLRDSDRVGPTELLAIDREASRFMDVAGGCERIRNTLMARSFPRLAHQALMLYLLYVPWSLADEFGLYLPLVMIVFSYFLIATEGIAHDVERPFGGYSDQLDLAAICDGIETSVKEILADARG